MDIIIDHIKMEDIPEVSAIEKLSFSFPWPVSFFTKELTSPESCYLVARSQEKIIGYTGMQKILDEGHINNLAVHPDFRRQGIGRKLVSELIREGDQLGIKRYLLEVRASNLAAQKLYENFGFAVISCRKNYYQEPTEDALVMVMERTSGMEEEI